MNQNFSFQKPTIFQKYWSNETNQKKIAKVYRILPYFIVQKSLEMLQRLLKLNFRSTKVHIKEQTLNTVSETVKVFCKSLPVIRFLTRCCVRSREKELWMGSFLTEEGTCIDVCDGTLYKAEIWWRSELGKNEKEAVKMTWAVNFLGKSMYFYCIIGHDPIFRSIKLQKRAKYVFNSPKACGIITKTEQTPFKKLHQLGVAALYLMCSSR